MSNPFATNANNPNEREGFKEQFKTKNNPSRSLAIENFKNQSNSKQVKKPVSFSLHIELIEQINDFCERNMINKSAFAARAFEDLLKKIDNDNN